MIRNPYAKPSPSNPCAKKKPRTEQDQQGSNHRVAATAGNSSTDHEAWHVAPEQPATTAAVSSNTARPLGDRGNQSNGDKQGYNDFDDDGGIDWEAAVRQMDENVVASGADISGARPLSSTMDGTARGQFGDSAQASSRPPTVYSRRPTAPLPRPMAPSTQTVASHGPPPTAAASLHHPVAAARGSAPNNNRPPTAHSRRTAPLPRPAESSATRTVVTDVHVPPPTAAASLNNSLRSISSLPISTSTHVAASVSLQPAASSAMAALPSNLRPGPLPPAIPKERPTSAQTSAASVSHTEPGRVNGSTASSISLLRPASWSNNVTTKPMAPSPSQRLQTHAPQCFPHQESLPNVLRFGPDTCKPISDSYRPKLVQHAQLSQPLLNGWTLYSHQKKAILRGLLMRRMLLALDMGLGKTLIGCVWAKAFQKTFVDLKIICVCPVTLKKEWKRTMEEATGLQVQEEKKDACDDSTDVYICSWAKVPTTVSTPHYVVVCDEAHLMQNINSGRTKDVLKLVDSEKCVGVLLLSGTPMKNGKPSNLFPLLKAVRHPFGRHQRTYEMHFCAGREQNFGRGRTVWNASGSSNLAQLRQLVASHVLHLTKDECLKDLPPQKRIFHHVPVCSRQQLKHNQALQDLAKVYTASSSMENGNDAVLGAVTRLRMVDSFAKIAATVELAKTILEEEPALVIFTSFVEVAKKVHKKLAEAGCIAEVLTGETQSKKRQDMVDNFQNGLVSTFCCTFGAGGVGLTLTAAATVILLDRPWTPGDAYQAEDRVRRIGQTKPVRSIWVSAFDLDKQIDNMLEAKNQNATVVLAGGGNPNHQAAPPRLELFKLVKAILPGTNQSADGLTQTTLPFASQNV